MARRKKRKSGSSVPIVIVAAGLVLIFVALVWFLNQDGGPAASPPAANIPFPEIPRVSLADAKAAHETGAAIFLDVRGEPIYQQSHIPGALSIPLNEVTARLDELDRSSWIITYCT